MSTILKNFTPEQNYTLMRDKVIADNVGLTNFNEGSNTRAILEAVGLIASTIGFDYLEAIRQAAPYVCHLHGSDNFGRLGGMFSSLSDRIPYGDGDVHLPPGWGDIPYVEAFLQLSGYEGLYVLELPPHFRNDFPEILETVQQMIRESLYEPKTTNQ